MQRQKSPENQSSKNRKQAIFINKVYRDDFIAQTKLFLLAYSEQSI